MAEWMFRRITDYWDDQKNAIYRGGQLLELLPDEGRVREADKIRAAVIRHAGTLSDKQLAMAAFIAAEDLYKAVTRLTYWDDSLGQYLEATAATLLKTLAERGFRLHYLVDNSFEPTATGLAGPVEWYPTWFRSAGFRYICPQQAATLMMNADGLSPAEYWSEMPRYIVEARGIAAAVVDRCHENDDNYVFLDADSADDSFERPMSAVGNAGVITVFRSEPPLPGSKSRVWLPPALT